MTISARGSLVTATAVVALALGGCAGVPATGATAAASGGGGGGGRPDQKQKIAQCLQAAGLPVPSFAPRPSRDPAAPPTRAPGTTRAPGQNRGFADPRVRAALQACGITLPTRAPGAAARPTATT
jgi:hypothetical protein